MRVITIKSYLIIFFAESFCVGLITLIIP